MAHKAASATPVAAAPGGSGSAVLIVGGAGFIGHFVAEAAIASGLPTFVLVRRTCSSSAAALRRRGAIILEGSAQDKDLVEKTLRENAIAVVISAVGGGEILDQLSLLDAIRAAGTVQRFLPSEFGHDVDKANPVEPGLRLYEAKRRVRRAIEEAAEAGAVTYTYICCNSIAAWPYHDNIHPSEAPPPLDRFVIYGDGSVRAYFVAGSDIGKMTIRAAYDPRAACKSVHFRPASNYVSMNDMAALWEAKIGRKLPRVALTEEDLICLARENKIPSSVVAAITHDIFINGCQSNYTIDGVKDVEITSLYPEVKFQHLDDCFNCYLRALVPRDHESQNDNDSTCDKKEAFQYRLTGF